MYKSPLCFLPSFKSVGLSVPEKKQKLDFQDGGHLGFPFGTNLAMFNLQTVKKDCPLPPPPPLTPTQCRHKSPRCFLPSIESVGLSVQKMQKKKKIDFLDGHHIGFPIGTTLATSDLQVTLMLPTKFQVNWPFGSGEEAKNRFSRWPPRATSTSDRIDLSYFLSKSHSDASFQVSSQLAIWFRKRSEK